MHKIGTAVVGCGRRGGDLARTLRASRDFDLVAVCDTDEQRLRALGREHATEMVSDYAALLRRDDIDAIAIATPQFSHRNLAVGAFGQGRHVFCEKPLACTVKECDDMIAAAREARRVFIVGQQMRYHLHLQRIAELIQDGVIGDPTMLWLKEMRGPFRVSPEHMWIFDQSKSGGMLVEKSCHHFDMFNWLTFSKPVSVYASGGQDVFHEMAGENNTICDNAFAVVNYENGARATLTLCMFLGRSHPREGGIGYHQRDIGVAGESGLIQTEGGMPQHAINIHESTSHNTTRIQLGPNGTVPTPFNQPGNVGIFMDFAACIREGRVACRAEVDRGEARGRDLGDLCALTEGGCSASN